MLQTALLIASLSLAAALLLQRARHGSALRESEAKFRTLLEHAPEAVVVLDVEAGTFSEVNERAVRLFGRSRHELLQLGPVDVSPPEQPDGEPSAQASARRIEEAADGSTPVFEWWHQNAAGDVIPCELRLVRLPTRGPALLRGSIVDISARKASEELHRALEAQLHQSSKLEAVGQLTGGVAHDFNNILTTAMGNLELLLDALRENPDLGALAQESFEALSRGAVVTARLLAFSRRQALRPEILDIGDVLRGMTDLLRRTVGETIEIEASIAEDLWSCRADAAQLENCILNLAVNARDAMPDGGTLGIDVRNRRAFPTEMDAWFGEADGPSVPASRDFLEIAIADSGTGMDADTVKRAFEPFFTTKEVGKGSGLGLSTIYGFAKQSGGHAEIRSTPEEGTTVVLRLPRVSESPGTSQTRDDPAGATAPDTSVSHDAQASPPDGPREGRVLFVEDDPGDRHVGIAFLEGMGYSCVAFADALDAMSFLEQDDEVDLLFTDVMLPGGVDGIELARRVRDVLPDLPIVFCSGYVEDAADLANIDDLGRLVAKPYTRQDLAEAL